MSDDTDTDLKGALTNIRGVGDATADTILDVLAEYDTGEQAVDKSPLMEKAIDAAERGDDRNAAMYLRRAKRKH